MMVFTLAASTARDRPRTDRPDLLQAPPIPVVGEYQLQPLGDGFTYEEQTFTARIARDGVVTFHDREFFFDRLGLLPQYVPGELPWPTLEYLLFTRRHGPLLIPPVPEGPFPGSPADPIDWSVLCPQQSTCYALPTQLVVTGVGVSADLTDEFLHALGQDLYRMQKARFLAATFDVRMRLAVQAHQDDLRTSLEQLPERLAELWHNPRYSAPERRHILFELWREADQGDAGEQARGIILTFIRRILPCKSPEAYPPAELHALQASTPSFSPYGACGR